jgi:hypothetical protein
MPALWALKIPQNVKKISQAHDTGCLELEQWVAGEGFQWMIAY